MRTAADGVAVVDRVRSDGVFPYRLLRDPYHLPSNGDDLDAAIAACVGVTGVVQIADAPGRGESGTDVIDLDRHLRAF